MILLLAGVLAMAALLTVWMLHANNRTSSAVDDPVPAASTPSGIRSSAVPGSSTPPGSDDAKATSAPAGSQSAASDFVAAWLEPDTDARKQALQGTAVPGLAEQLMMTARENVPDAKPAGPPVLEHVSTYSAEYTQRLTDGTAIRIYLAADPQAEHGWVATSVEQA
ncbi:hypothetical protein FOE78_02910 [Microlunatus elymi]|uniref:Uncharacterized protein n=1 Tax=Microlunatus elymi TaxID=2596828 RepID=A0A516PV28_9ACTN|nr:hypothetical protein [Microlunatus elymi]QDP95003.1 hypothetical protein FOE78_02910 [Microlunatus elymi]